MAYPVRGVMSTARLRARNLIAVCRNLGRGRFLVIRLQPHGPSSHQLNGWVHENRRLLPAPHNSEPVNMSSMQKELRVLYLDSYLRRRSFASLYCSLHWFRACVDWPRLSRSQIHGEVIRVHDDFKSDAFQLPGTNSTSSQT